MSVADGVQLAYLLSAVLFVSGLKKLSSPATARSGNALAALAMGVAIIAVLVETQILDWTAILIGVAAGSLV